ncbi:MAG: polyprenyl synthetase family protein [Candidatus Fervidibacter sp.]|uniref:polyprenyl synthetase family protein n=1 Tax=Candidatus Fervidibacter sp. TaxID=3100871 RepID=UPI00404B4729
MKGIQRLVLNTRWDGTLTEVFTFLQKPMEGVEETLRRAVQSPVKNITEMALHLLSAGGKRLRPALTLLCAELTGGIGRRSITFASAVELMHTASLIHDDVIDKAELRRGRAAVHTLWGNEAAVICGDFLYATAFNMMAEDGDIEVIRTMVFASSQICQGEVLELQLAFNPYVTEEQCIEIARLKTAELMAVACKIGAMTNGANGEIVNALESFGRNLGIAFQIVDDVLDMEGSIEEIGKPVGSDLLEGKVTLPIRFALDALPNKEREIWARRIYERAVTPKDVAEFARFAKGEGILDRSRKVAEKFAQKAMTNLNSAVSEQGLTNSSKVLPMLKLISDFFVYRRM